MSPNVATVLEIISRLSREEILELRLRLQQLPGWGGDEEGGIGVREPRVPFPESPGDAIALEE